MSRILGVYGKRVFEGLFTVLSKYEDRYLIKRKIQS